MDAGNSRISRSEVVKNHLDGDLTPLATETEVDRPSWFSRDLEDLSISSATCSSRTTSAAWQEPRGLRARRGIIPPSRGRTGFGPKRMKTLLRVGASTAIGAVLAFGLVAIKQLEQTTAIGHDAAFVLVVFVFCVFVSQKFYTELPKPVSPHLAKGRHVVIDRFLEGFLQEYRKLIRTMRGETSLPVVRANVMLPTRKAKGLLGTKLKIFYWSTAGDFAYSDEERTRLWKRKEGTCGWAWKYSEPCFFDSEKHPGPAKRLRKIEDPKIRAIVSVLSIPISTEGGIVGVLNLDSLAGIEQTCFDKEHVVHLAEACAVQIGPLCPPEGVHR